MEGRGHRHTFARIYGPPRSTTSQRSRLRPLPSRSRLLRRWMLKALAQEDNRVVDRTRESIGHLVDGRLQSEYPILPKMHKRNTIKPSSQVLCVGWRGRDSIGPQGEPRTRPTRPPVRRSRTLRTRSSAPTPIGRIDTNYPSEQPMQVGFELSLDFGRHFAQQIGDGIHTTHQPWPTPFSRIWVTVFLCNPLSVPR